MNESKALLENLFEILNVKIEDNIILADVALCKQNDIFKAHFPGNPITPGVCQLYLVKFLVQKKIANQPVTFVKSKELKFTHILTPNKTTDFKVEIKIIQNDKIINAEAKLFDKENVFLKSKITYQIG